MKTACLLVLAAALSGCAASPADNVASGGGADPAQQLVCTKEAPTGTMFNVTKCRTAEQIQRERDATRAAGDGIDRARSGLRGPASGP